MRVRAVQAGEGELTVAPMDGRTISMALAWYPRLLAGTPAQRAGWTLAGAGCGVHWAGAGWGPGHGRAAGRGAGAARVGCLALAPAGRDAGASSLLRRPYLPKPGYPGTAMETIARSVYALRTLGASFEPGRKDSPLFNDMLEAADDWRGFGEPLLRNGSRDRFPGRVPAGGRAARDATGLLQPGDQEHP